LYADEGGCTLSVGPRSQIEIPASFFSDGRSAGSGHVDFRIKEGQRYVAEGKYALIRIFSGIGRAIALKLAECGVKIGVHYYKNIDAANDTLAKSTEAPL